MGYHLGNPLYVIYTCYAVYPWQIALLQSLPFDLRKKIGLYAKDIIYGLR